MIRAARSYLFLQIQLEPTGLLLEAEQPIDRNWACCRGAFVESLLADIGDAVIAP